MKPLKTRDYRLVRVVSTPHGERETVILETYTRDAAFKVRDAFRAEYPDERYTVQEAKWSNVSRGGTRLDDHGA